ncbi:DNA-binding response regulator [Paenibacillus agaridevorans]|uniref:DNA-binding response regulator n=1 Tax=Paenibacillus agaridevorans TaxID=171404 RepID=A0A2R5ERE3_9BACL|nr:response regulator [Paenibacillus agaridevorans]GBG05964.1 DNA-binding response regulator [Paenibacillus agaridevorans]
MKVLIVDDEMIVRVGIKSIIQWDQLGCECVGEAGDGLEALEMIGRFNPDLVLTDIIMPEMDGIALLKEVNLRHPHIKVVILTCYNDFKYVQEALRLGAVDYLMKLSIKPQELHNMMQKVKMDLQDEQHRRADHLTMQQKLNVSAQAYKEGLLWDACKGKISTRSRWSELSAEWNVELNGDIGIIYMRINDFDKMVRKEQLKNPDTMIFAAANIAAEIVKKRGAGEVVKSEAGELVMFVQTRQENWLDLSRQLAMQIQDAVFKFLKLPLRVGISLHTASLPFLNESYTDAVNAYKHGFFHHSSSILTSVDLTNVADDLIILEMDELTGLKRLIEDQNVGMLKTRMLMLIADKTSGKAYTEQRVREFFHELLQPFHQHLKSSQQSLYTLPEFMDYYPYEAISQIEQFDQMQEWVLQFVEHYFSVENRSRKTPPKKEIIATQDYIRQHLQEKISVATLAGRIGYTESYFSHLYKKETGESIVEYMTRARLDKAKELLKSSDMKIYEIVELVGFMDPNYFTRQFKRFEGVTPLEYKNGLRPVGDLENRGG